MSAKRKEVSPLEQEARDKAAWLLFRYADPRIRPRVDVRSMDNGAAFDQKQLERDRAGAGHPVLQELEASSPAIAELLLAACYARDNTAASSHARAAAALLVAKRFPGQGIVRDAELVDE